MNEPQSSISEQLAKFLSERNLNTEEELVPAAEELEPVVNAPVETVVVQEPIVRTAETIVLAPTTKENRETKLQLFNWYKTRLNLVLVQRGTASEQEITEFNGVPVYLNLPLNVLKVSEENKVSGYLNKYLRGFAKALRDVTRQDSVNQLGSTKEVMEFYTSIAVAILESTSKVLPTNENPRVKVYGEISTEKNNFVNDIVFDFYLVYETDYTNSDELLEKLAKIDKAIESDKLVSELFSFVTTTVFPLSNIPNNLASWYTAGYKQEDYATTAKLPDKRDCRLEILGAVAKTLQSVPHIVLSKQL